jgi:hypothetical protein
VDKFDAVAVRIDDRGQLQAENIPAARQTGVRREAEIIFGAVDGAGEHAAVRHFFNFDGRPLLDPLAKNAGRHGNEFFAVAEIFQGPGVGAVVAREPGSERPLDRGQAQRPAEAEHVRASARVVAQRQLGREAGTARRDLQREGHAGEAARGADLVAGAEALDRGGPAREVDRRGERGAGVGVGGNRRA